MIWQLLITFAALSGLVFCLVYGALAPWWRSQIGWNLMLMAAALTSAFGMLAGRAWFGPLGLPAWISVVLVIAVTLNWRTVLFVVEHRRAKREGEQQGPVFDPYRRR